MTPTYTDASEWLRDNVESGAISAQDLLVFTLNEVSNDDIERWFGVNMDDDSDNPGAGMMYCVECLTDVDESDYDFDNDMCNQCWADLQAENEEVFEADCFEYVRMTNGKYLILSAPDFDSPRNPADYTDYPPFESEG